MIFVRLRDLCRFITVACINHATVQEAEAIVTFYTADLGSERKNLRQERKTKTTGFVSR